jgi:hypothetical protein
MPLQVGLPLRWKEESPALFIPPSPVCQLKFSKLKLSSVFGFPSNLSSSRYPSRFILKLIKFNICHTKHIVIDHTWRDSHLVAMLCNFMSLCMILFVALETQEVFEENYLYHYVRFEVFTAVTMKNGVFWDVTPCGSCKNRRFGGRSRLLHQGDKNRWTRNNTSCI